MTFNQWWGGRNLGNKIPEDRITEVDERVCRRAWYARDVEIAELNAQINVLIEESGNR